MQRNPRFIHELEELPDGEELMAASDFHDDHGTQWLCLTPELFTDAVYWVIFSMTRMMFYPEDDLRVRRRLEVRCLSDLWIPTKIRREVLVALYQTNRWRDVTDHVEFRISLLPYSASSKGKIILHYFSTAEPRLRSAVQEAIEIRH